MNNLGSLYHDLADFESAIDCYKQQLAIAVEINDRESEAIIHIDIAVALEQLGNIESAIVCVENAMRIYENLNDIDTIPHVEEIFGTLTGS